MKPSRGGDREFPRRAVLAGTGVVAASGLAGCLGGGFGAGGDGGDGSGASPTTDGAAGGTTAAGNIQPLEDHPAAAGIESQPTLGPDPFEADAVIVAFEDPSCSTCADFEAKTVPQIESKLVASGEAAFVFRGYPVIYPWGKPATQALESTYARDADAFWALKDHYFAEQSSFSEANVLDRTRSFLVEETDLDAEAVVADAESKAHDAAVQADLSAGVEAGAGGTTPTVFLFRDGRYWTNAAGSVSFSVVKNALGL